MMSDASIGRSKDLSTELESVEEPGRRPDYVVGIGASAGGLESLEKLFSHMPEASGMAFIVIQHLSPDFKSMMPELLARCTDLKILIAEDGQLVEADTIYLMPAKKDMIIADGRLHLLDRQSGQGLVLPIDRFLESLARECGERAIAIILSGSGTDGSRGITEVARQGGLVLSENLQSAKFDGMPSSAQATGMVATTIAPEEAGQLLLGYKNSADHELRLKIQNARGPAVLTGMEAILQLFRDAFEIDFAVYKESTVLRRIQRRMNIKKCETLDQYLAVLQSDSTEFHALYNDLLIGVTQFFRDPAVFNRLTTRVLPELIKNGSRKEGLRAWVAGCATGEEAYSIAIAFCEAMRQAGRLVPIKIFATDVYRRSIELASRGVYRSDLLGGLTNDLRDRYFQTQGDSYQVRSEVRKMVVFAPHNVLCDAPFTGLDFVSCRNLLIYLQPVAQKRALTLFHYGLRVGGVLLLGSSESIGELKREFKVVSQQLRLYRKSRDVRLVNHLRAPIAPAAGAQPRILPSIATPRMAETRVQDVYAQLLERNIPPSVLIDEDRHVIDTFAGAERLLRFPPGQPTLDVLGLVDRQLRTSLSGAMARAAKERETVRLSKLAIQNQEGQFLANLAVEPINSRTGETFYWISFSILTDPSHTDSVTTEAELSTANNQLTVSQNHIRQLEDDLRYSRENLQATIEELETSNEELQATNEELIASNEELQSTNEELHSLNEELFSVNSEHQRKIEELAELNRDMNCLLENTDVATVFLDHELRIRRFTSRVAEVFELIDDDVGRPISAFAAKLHIASLSEKLHKVLTDDRPYEEEVRSGDDRIYLMRLLPYRTSTGIHGVVMMWVDISSVEILRGRLRWLSAIVESTSDAIIGQDLTGKITSWNRGAEVLYGYKAHEVIGQTIDILTPLDRRSEVLEYRERLMRGETIHSVDTIRLNCRQEPIHVSLTVSPVVNSSGEVMGISKIARDIKPRIEMEREIREQIAQREYFLAMLSHELRNPFNAIRCASLVAADARTTEQTRLSAIQAIDRQVEIVNHLLADLLDVARIAENRINLNFEVFDLRELRQAVEELVQDELERHQCQLLFEFGDTPALVRGDRTRLIQVQVNLINNAAKYSESTSPIVVKLNCHESEVHLSVSDCGHGIPAEKLDAIFEPFTQLGQSLARSDGGLGVGLTLAKSLVTMHGGTIHAESAGLGYGSTFHVKLPRVIADEMESAITQRPAAGNHARPSNKVITPVARPLTICVVEDVDDSREMIKAILQLDGHNVLTASTGRAAIAVLTSEHVDIALIDIGLPDMSGYEVVQEVRSHLSGRCRLVALTGFGQPSDLEKTLEAGFDDHMVKPLDLERLEKLIQDLMDDQA